MALIITLIILGLLLILAEILIIPGFAITGILGIGSIVASCYFAFVEYGNLGGAITIGINIILLIFFVVLSLRSKTWKKISLTTNIDSRSDSVPEEKGIEIGSKGVTITRLNPMGKARINSVTLEVVSQENLIDPNMEIEVSYIEDNKVYVKNINE